MPDPQRGNARDVNTLHWHTTAGRFRRASLWLGLFGLLAFLLADLEITTLSPGTELARIGSGFLTPDFAATEFLWHALANTLAFAFQGVALGVIAGFVLALCWQYRAVRTVSAVIRAVHELFWGLIFLQLTGLSPLTGVLAIAVPYAGIFAKVFGEFLEEADGRPARALPTGSPRLAAFFHARLPLILFPLRTYSAYRLECGLRASAILGFIGLPTLGFHLETAFRQGDYSAGAAILYLFFLLIGTLRWWLHRRLLPLYLGAALWWAPPLSTAPAGTLWRFLSEDIVPAPLRQGAGLEGLWHWTLRLMGEQALPGVWHTLVLSSAALLLTALLSLLLFPLISPRFGSPWRRGIGHLLLVVLRTTPEFLLAFILLLLFGPSMLPGIIALALHTSAIVAWLSGRFTLQWPARADGATGVRGYFFEVLPRVYPNLLALLLYRWEIIMRETAILGILGITTLGFFVDAAFAEFRFDRAMLLILVSVLLNLAVDAFSRRLRQHLRLSLNEGRTLARLTPAMPGAAR
ncbi:PhnE/PtxC family ABC transporter permease [Isoalcanivorax indicus]|uniref:PhnE/PtxC family ABC transporter permease n=1 Tax=Isoalcanivorax indicus TaxID=2202653 RepID=UPI001FEC9617|nr:ABC transporter permease subunit [Isoalcanivorax indicus]